MTTVTTAPVPRSISVVVPTYARPHQLLDCLGGLLAQQRAPEEIVVVRRPTDAATAEVLAELCENAPALKVATVDVNGVLAAMAAGIRAATGDVIAFTDDDAVARPDWIARLLAHYDDPRVGAVGGRDDVHPEDGGGPVPSDQVGRITSWGKLRGEHNHGVGPPARVEVLKGVNMSFRREALALPRNMRGSGAQVHFEIATCLWARRAGWQLVYDPAVRVDHFPGARFDNDQRHRPDAAAVANEAYNLVTAILDQQPKLLARRAVYGLLVGDRATPGFLRAGVAVARRDRATSAKYLPSVTGQLRALLDVARGRRLDLEPAPARQT